MTRFNVLVGMAALCSAETQDNASHSADMEFTREEVEAKVGDVAEELNEALAHEMGAGHEMSPEAMEVHRMLQDREVQKMLVSSIMGTQDMKSFYDKISAATPETRMAVLGRYEEALTAKFGVETTKPMIEVLKLAVDMLAVQESGDLKFPDMESQADLMNVFTLLSGQKLFQAQLPENSEATAELEALLEALAEAEEDVPPTKEEAEAEDEKMTEEMTESVKKFITVTHNFVREENASELRKKAVVGDVTE